MTAHPRFEEIAEFVSAKKIDAEYFRTAARINAHICACPECKTIYDTLLTAQERAERFAWMRTMEADSVVSAPAKEKRVKLAMEQLVQSGRDFLLKVRSLTEIAVEGLQMQHPMQLATVKSTGTQNMQNREMPSVLTDEAGNRIRIDVDGSLSLYFDRTLMPVGQVVILIREESEERLISRVTEYDQNTTRVCFDGIEPGEFRVLLG